VDVLRFVFDLLIIVGYFAVAFVLGSWLMAAAPIALALLLVVIIVIRDRLNPEEGGNR
jgi:hypothetical protein